MNNLKSTAGTTLLLILITCSLSAARKTIQTIHMPYDSINEQYAYTRIVEAPQLNDMQLYILAKKWTKQKFGDDHYLIDDVNTQLADRGSFSFLYAYNKLCEPFTFNINYKLNLQFKNGKYKIEINNINLIEIKEGASVETSIENFQKEQERVVLARKTIRRITTEVLNQIDTKLLKVISEIENSLTANNLNTENW